MTIQHTEWKKQYQDDTVANDVAFWEMLNKPVLINIRLDRKKETLKSSFKEELLKMFTEIYNWKKTST